jgi:tetratricopeptide (TPR) repeat protein
MIPTQDQTRLAPPDALQLAAQLKRQWREGDVSPDAAGALLDHSGLAGHKSVVLDLAYEEYCLREEAGAAPDVGSFCARFGSFRGSLRKVLEAHRLMADHPELLAVPPVDWPAAGETVEGLELLGELGRGAFGRAYAAFDPQTGRPCVLKLSSGRSAEAQVIGGLRHPNVIDVYWARPVGRLSAVCMPLVGTTTLDEARESAFAVGPPKSTDALLAAIDPTGGPVAEGPAVVRPGEPYPVGVAALAERIADALAYLHRAGVAHGDLKPSNVVLGSGGRPYLIDFNLSVTGERPDGVPGGTLPYMAPELLRSVAEVVQPTGLSAARADVYAFGVTVFELLTGRLPAEPPKSTDAPTAATELLARLTGPTPRVRDLAPVVPAGVARVIDRCLAADPAARPEAAEVVASLKRFLHSTRDRGARWKRRGWVAAVCTVVGLAATGWAIRPNAAPTASLPSPQEKEPETAEEYFERGLKFLHAGVYPSAYSDFGTANQLKENPQAIAYKAYCLGLMGQPAIGVDIGRMALEKGATGPAVQNNLGFCLHDAGQYVQAIPHLEEALRQSPQMREAQYNLAVARFQVMQQRGRKMPDPACVAAIDAFLQSGPASFRSLYLAATIYAANMTLGPDLRARAIRCLVLAVGKGLRPAQIEMNQILRQCLGNDPEYRQVLMMTPGPMGPNTDQWLVEPVDR